MDMLQRAVECSRWVEDVHVDAGNTDEWASIAHMNEKRCGLFPPVMIPGVVCFI